MEEHAVEISNDHIARQAQCSPEASIEELIWNGLDAGGNLVEVRIVENEAGGIREIEVEDHGKGIAFEDLPRAFGTIGKSLKLRGSRTSEGRVYHGREGRGRFKAIVLGQHAWWRTTYEKNGELLTYNIHVSRNTPKKYENDEEPQRATEGATGTVVRIEGVDKPLTRLASENASERLTEHLALYLRNYLKVRVRYNGHFIDIKPLIKHDKNYELPPTADSQIPAQLSIIEWEHPITSKKLLIADSDGFTWHEMQASVPARDIFYTAYLQFELARQWADEGCFAAGEVDPDISHLVERARAALREHVQNRLAEQARNLVKEWKAEEIYPYKIEEPENVVEKAERRVFDIVASRVHRYHTAFRSGTTESRQFTLQLVKQALESNPSSLKRILEGVLRLPKQQQDELATLLESTSLPGLIRAASVVRDNLHALAGFDEIIFGEDWKVRLKERTQLHRLLVHHLWIFGEAYALDTDDDKLRAVLEKHLKHLGRELLAEEVDPKLIGGKDAIPDLMLSRAFDRDQGRLEHLVIELKRPSTKLGHKEITQIEQYAFAVSSDERFSKTEVLWRFVLLGNDWDAFAKQKAGEKERPYGCIGLYDNLSIWIQRWNDVLHEARNRYKFFSKKLEIEASTDEGIQHLEKNYPDLMTGGLTKKQEKEKMESGQAEKGA